MTLIPLAEFFLAFFGRSPLIRLCRFTLGVAWNLQGLAHFAVTEVATRSTKEVMDYLHPGNA